MKLEVTVDKRALLIAAFLFVVVGSVFVYAVTPNPGHDANTVGDGANGQVFGGTSTFAGGAGSWYSFPGHLGIGDKSINPGYGVDLFINSSDAWAGIDISSTGYAGDTYIDFMKNGSIKSNINVKYDPGLLHERLEINAHPGAANTDALIVTPNYFTIKGRSSTSAASPAIRLSEVGSNSDWHIIKRSSQYPDAPSQQDGLLFAYWNGVSWDQYLIFNKTGSIIATNPLYLTDAYQPYGSSVQPYERKTTRYIFSIDSSSVGVVRQIENQVIREYCEDLDGCQITFGLKDFSSSFPGMTASYGPITVYTNAVTSPYYWRVSYSAGDNYGRDSGGAVENVAAPWGKCVLTDAETSTNNNNGRADNGIAFGFLNARGVGGFSDVTSVCTLIIED